MLTLLLIAAEKAELAGILSRCRNIRKTDGKIRFAGEAEWRGNRLLFAANGPGPQLAGQAVDMAFGEMGMVRVDAIINTGLCGALDPALAVNGIFAASRVMGENGEPAFDASLPSCSQPFTSGWMISTDRFVGTREAKAALHAKGASAVEMEALGVAAIAAAQKIPFYCIRAVSDNADDGFDMDFNQLRDASGRFDLPRIVLHAMARPSRRFPELLKLKRNSESAAKALGEFFDHCRF